MENNRLEMGDILYLYNEKQSELRFPGMYFGYSADEKRHIFFVYNDKRVLRYSAGSIKVEWHGDCGDDEPAVSIIPVTFDYVLENRMEKRLVLKSMQRHGMRLK